MKLLFAGDWHLKESNLHLARPVVDFIAAEYACNEYRAFIHGGDLFDEITSETEFFARDKLTDIAQAHGCGNPAYLLVGNHDWEARQNWLSALFDPDLFSVMDKPEIVDFEDVTLAFLPSPNRAMFGAGREAEGKKARDAALSEALETEMINLETRIGPENLHRAILFFHATVAGADTGTQILPKGLTWEIPAERLSRWGLAIGAHIHHPQQLASNVYYAGGIFSQNFGEKAEQYRILSIDAKDGIFDVRSIALPRVIVPIELILDQEGIRVKSGGLYYPIIVDLAPAINSVLIERCGVVSTDTIALKLRAKLPPNELKALPDPEDLKKALMGNVEKLVITREATGLHKVRLEGDVQEMSIEQLFDAWLAEPGNGADPETVDQAKLFLDSLEANSWMGRGKFGYVPQTLKVHNFCQWEDAEIDYRDFAGAVSITGPNKIGKTTLWVKGPTFALHKKTSKRQLLIDDELRNGETEGFVEHGFLAGGKQWFIRRALELSGRGVTCKTELFEVLEVLDGHRFDPVEQNANDIQSFIDDELVGTYEFVLSTFLGTQDDINRLIQATSADWGRLFLEALGLSRFEAPRKTAAEKAQKLQEQIGETKVRIESNEEWIEENRASLAKLGDLSEIKDRLTGLESDKGQHETLYSKAQEEKDVLIAEKAEIEAKGRERRRLDDRRQAISLRTGELKIRVVDIGPRPEAPTRENIAALEEENTRLARRYNELGQKDRESRSKLRDLQEKLKAENRDFETLDAANRSLHKDIDEHLTTLRDLPELPCKDLEADVRDKCPAFRAFSQASHGERLGMQISSNRVALETSKRVIGEIEGDLLVIELVNQDVLKGLEKAASDGVESQRQKEAQLRTAEEWDLKKQSVDGYRRSLCELEDERTEISKQLETIGDPGEQMVGVQERLETLDARLDASKKLLAAIQESITELSEQKGRIQELSNNIELRSEQAEKQRGMLKAHELHGRAWSLLQFAFHASGIPYLLMERMVGAFEHEANEILSPTGMSVRIETVTPTKKGEARDKISLSFIDERGEHPLPKASGYQTAALGMALRAAMAIVGAKFYGNVPEMYVQDEGWGAFDEENYDIARELISSIAQRFRLFPYITQIERLAASADMRVRIIRDGNGAPVLDTGKEVAKEAA